MSMYYEELNLSYAMNCLERKTLEVLHGLETKRNYSTALSNPYDLSCLHLQEVGIPFHWYYQTMLQIVYNTTT